MILKTGHFPRYTEIGRILWRYGRNLQKLGQTNRSPHEQGSTDTNGLSPDAFTRDLERMGPTFVKLGQLLATRADLLPDSYLQALSRLQDRVEPFSFEDVEAIVQTELGARLSKAFSEFERKPLAAASLGQVHRARLRDGREVAVKVQRPNMREKVTEDLEVLGEIATFLQQHTALGRQHRLVQILDQFRRTLFQELDYQREASNLTVIGKNLRDFVHIDVATPIADYTTRAVLTMDYVSGTKITEVGPLARLDVDVAMLADELFKAYLKQVLVDGLFHADPHPGNVFLTEQNHLALLDLGMVGRVTPGMQENLIKLLLAVSEGCSEDAAQLAIQISEPTDDFDEPTFKRLIGALVSEMQDHTLCQIDVGRALLQIGRSAGQTGLFVPIELTMLGKTLLQLHDIGQHLDSQFDPNAAIRRHVSSLVDQRMRKNLTWNQLFSSLFEIKEFLGQLPVRLNRFLDAVGESQIELKLRNADTLQLLDGFQKVANRIAAGLVLAALIVGAALLMRVNTEFKILGYPGLAMLCFFAAAAGGVWLLFDIFFRDAKRPKNASLKR